MHKKRDKKGRFTKVRIWWRNFKIATIAIILWQYFEPAIEIIWQHEVTPYLAQFVK